MKNYTDEEIKSLIERFESRKLPKLEWTHEAHLVVAVWYCKNYEFDEALALVRKNISSHNESVGTENTDSSGYHETITKFWLLIANSFLENKEAFSMEESCNAFINSKLGTSKLPFNYYSSESLFSIEARRYWIEPDLKLLSYNLRR